MPSPSQPPPRRIIHGIATSPGLALGPVQVVRTGKDAVPTWSVAGEDVGREIERLHAALDAAAREMTRRQELVSAQAGEKDAQIFAVHRMILSDPAALKEVERHVRDLRINAESAVERLIERLERTLSGLEGDSVRGYAADLSDPWHSVLEALMQSDRQEVSAGSERFVLAAAELTPHVMTYLPRERLLGVIAETGGRFSHAAVLARAFGVPCVVGVPGLLARLEQGMPVIVDGSRGTVQLRPDNESVQQFMRQRVQLETRRAELANEASLPAETRDGQRLGVLVNIESLRDLDTFEPRRTDGLGLLRTEFLYMERPQFPSEDEQFRLYRRALERMDGKPVTLRTLDIGGDKKLSYFQIPPEPNPALGWRGLRISLEWRDLLRVQLRAALRAGAGHDLRILLPMVTSVEEIEIVHTTFDEVRASLIEQGYEVEAQVPVGAMIEVPSALLCIEEVLAAVDFVSVGTNDLIQYLLAADRDNPRVSRFYDPHHPAVVRALARVAEASRAAAKHCSVCGDVADDPAYAILLLGLGYDAVSVAPGFHPEIKFAVRHTTSQEAAELAAAVLAQRDSRGVRDLLERVHARLLSES
ncbi:MAG TPA: phosphoenolpyruvate--protein phosphotransferase [Planctomycetota bacterium]|nr:phosphoenolpyruvate--protein phosphotransferase [Planctomycetota bacterium]